MKKITPLIGALLMATCTFAQFEWAGLGRDVDKYVLTKNGGHIILRDSLFTAVDDMGNFLLQYPYPGNNYVILDIFALPDSTNCYIFKSFENFEETHFCVRYDKDWTWPGLNGIDVYGNYPCSSNVGGITFDSQSLLVYQKGSDPITCPGSISKSLNNGGPYLWSKQYDGNIFKDIAVPNNQIFVCAEAGFLILDENGDITAQYDGQLFDRIKAVNDTSLLVQKSDTLIRISTAFALLDTLIVTDGHIQDFDAQHGRIGVLTTTGHYYIYDVELNAIGDFQLNNPSLEYTYTQMGSESVYLAGNFGAGEAPYQTEAVFAKAYTFNGEDTAPSKDIGIISISHGQEVTVNEINDYYKYQVIFDSVIVTVKNFGNTDIDGQYLSTGLQYPSMSEDFVTSVTKQFYHFIEAGGTDHLSWGKLFLRFHEYPSGPFNLCMWSVLPDDGFDINPSNDVGCADFFVETEEVINTTNVKVYPNPTQGHITLSSAAAFPPGTSWSLFDAFGKLAVKKDIPSGTQHHSIDLPDLTPGIYFWQLTAKDRYVGNGKLVILK